MARPGVLFDLFHTLIYPDPPNSPVGRVSQKLAESFRAVGIDVPEEEAIDIDRAIWRHGLSPPDGDSTRFERRLAAYLSAVHGVDLKPSLLRPAADAACLSWDDLIVFDPGLKETLESLSARYALGVVSNFDHYPYPHALLKRLDLAKYFDVVVISGEEDVEKPDPEIVYRACARMDSSPQNTVFVGDSITDYRVSTAAGMRFFWIRRSDSYSPDNEHFRETDEELRKRVEQGEIVLISSLTELLDYL